MCKHVAAVLYGIGARLDQQPELLFRLRAVDEKDLLAGSTQALPMTKAGPAAGKVLETDDLSAMFGLDMAEAELSPIHAPTKACRRREGAAQAGARRSSKPANRRALAGARTSRAQPCGVPDFPLAIPP